MTEENKNDKTAIEEEFPTDFYPYDKEDIRSFYKQITKRIQEAYKIPELMQHNFKTQDIDEIVFAGMGGSAIAGIIIKDYFAALKSKIKITVANSYHIPEKVSKNALVICISYSGNTEETLSMFKDARRNNFKVMSITSGGKLEEITNNYRMPLIKLPKRLHPRHAFPYMFFSAIKVLEKLNKLDPHDEIVKSLAKIIATKNFEKIGIDLAEKLYKKKIFVYSTKELQGIAYRWKTQFNENSKVACATHLFPELCHNELCQFMQDMKDSHVIILRTDTIERRMQKRIDITKKLISKNCEVTELDIKGSNLLTKFYTTVLIGDLASYYLALRYRRDPSDDSIIGQLKKELGPWMS